jgi:hypothetical protein
MGGRKAIPGITTAEKELRDLWGFGGSGCYVVTSRRVVGRIFIPVYQTTRCHVLCTSCTTPVALYAECRILVDW